MKITLEFNHVTEGLVPVEWCSEGAIVLYDNNLYTVEKHRTGMDKNDYWLRDFKDGILPDDGHIVGTGVYELEVELLGIPQYIHIHKCRASEAKG